MSYLVRLLVVVAYLERATSGVRASALCSPHVGVSSACQPCWPQSANSAVPSQHRGSAASCGLLLVARAPRISRTRLLPGPNPRELGGAGKGPYVNVRHRLSRVP